MDKEIRCIGVELRVKRDNDKPIIQGYAAVFDSWSEDLGGFREKIQPGAFKAAIGKSDVRALINHDSNLVLGRTKAGTLKISEDKTGLWMEIDPPDTQYARDLMTSIDRGDIDQQSFGFTVKTDQWEEDRDNDKVTRTIVEVDELFDVSPVTYPAYQDTSVALRAFITRKSAEIGDDNKKAAIRRKAEIIQHVCKRRIKKWTL